MHIFDLPQTSRLLFKFAQPAPHLTDSMLARPQYRSGFSPPPLIKGCSSGEGDDGWFRRNMTDNVARRPPSVDNAIKVCS